MTVLVTRDQSRPMRHEIRIGSLTLATDGTVEEGGESSAPTPHDLYDAALGACKALTVLWYAKRKGIPVESIEVRVERDDSQERAGIYRLDAQLRLGGPLSPAQREVLLSVAAKCPISKLMTAVKTEITTSLAV
jgi:putative redox protein